MKSCMQVLYCLSISEYSFNFLLLLAASYSTYVHDLTTKLILLFSPFGRFLISVWQYTCCLFCGCFFSKLVLSVVLMQKESTQERKQKQKLFTWVQSSVEVLQIRPIKQTHSATLEPIHQIASSSLISDCQASGMSYNVTCTHGLMLQWNPLYIWHSSQALAGNLQNTAPLLVLTLWPYVEHKVRIMCEIHLFAVQDQCLRGSTHSRRTLLQLDFSLKTGSRRRRDHNLCIYRWAM